MYHEGMKTSLLLSRGVSIVAVLSLGVLLAGCKQVGQTVQQKAQEAVTQVQTAFLTESDLSGIKDPLIRKNFVAQANAKSYRVVTSSGKSEGSTTTEIQIEGTNIKFHTTMHIGGKTQEMIVIGDTTYVKDPKENVWWKQVSVEKADDDKSTQFKAPSLSDIKEEFTNKQDTAEFKQLGTEACGTLSCYKYQETDGGDTSGVRTFWFDTKEYLLRKDEQKLGGVLTTNVYSYEGVNIQAPTPTKDVPEGHSAYEYMMGLPSAADTNKTSQVPSQAEIDAMMKKAQAGESSAPDASEDDGN